MTPHYELLRPGGRDDPYSAYAQLRAHAPLYWAEDAKSFCVSRHADVLAVLRSPEDFSSDAMRTMILGDAPGSDPMKDPATVQRLLRFAQALPFSPQELLTARNLIAEDPPRHGELRAIVNRGFTPRRIAAWEPRMRAIVGECLGKLRGAGDFDLVHDLAVPLPVRIIAELLGVAPERYPDFKRWSDQTISATTGSGRGKDPLENGMLGAVHELAVYVRSVAAEREKTPGDDLVSLLVDAQSGEARLTPHEVTLFVLILLVAGNETTTNLIGNAVLALLQHPDQLERLRADRALVPAAIEEVLRWDSPVQVIFRRATREAVLPSGTVPAGAVVALLLGSANRDEQQWGPTAGELQIDREQKGHLAFGFGNHFCLGASLARLEARVALEALLDELPVLRRREPGIEYVDSFLVRGPRSLPLLRAA